MSDEFATSPRLERREAVIIFAVAAAWFLTGFWWGTPVSTATMVMPHWGSDELAPLGALRAVEALLGDTPQLSPQYPLGQYLIQALFVWPYSLAVRAADNLGFAEQTASPAMLVLLARLPSVLMAAGTAVAAAAFVRRLTPDRWASWFAAVAVATIGPLVFYGRTSNVDAAMLFWTVLGLVAAADVLRDGLRPRNGSILGLIAAAAIGTKDPQAGFFLGIAIVIGVVHFRRAGKGPEEPTRWAGPLAGLGSSVGAYLLFSGALMLPRWFATHVEFILWGSAADQPEEIRTLVGFYFSNPATLAGYASVVVEGFRQVVAAVGIPILALAAVGSAVLARRHRAILALLWLPMLVLLFGVILPVRFVLPRFLLPVEAVACLLAALGLAAGLESARWRRMAQVTAALGLAWVGVRGVDLTWQMHRDARYEAARWIDRNLQPGDTLGFFGSRIKLPRLHRQILTIPAPHQDLVPRVYGEQGPVTDSPQFMIVIPRQLSEAAHEWTLPDSVFNELIEGTRGYQQVLAIQTPALFPRPLRTASLVNPPIRIFAREDLVGRLAGPIRVEVEGPPPPASLPR